MPDRDDPADFSCSRRTSKVNFAIKNILGVVVSEGGLPSTFTALDGLSPYRDHCLKFH